RVDKALNYVNMISYKRKLTTNLSGGEKQLISFASIIAMETKYMIFDEPTSLIDKFGRNEIIKILKKLKKDKTIIFVSHFLEEIFISDKIIVMKEGEIEFFDTPYNLLNNEKILKLIKFPLPFLLKIVKKYDLRPDKYEFLHVVKKLKEKIDENRS
ncbi:MAG TPA: energy-coupling factor ABC transporter ATP-binding protein, partial [Candidatus Mcinerneyibacterium sp.]|nr:energy-coupling factor ABC transporter ATP-binding protein [Candidatus Mcinerneyibacterium sp.]